MKKVILPVILAICMVFTMTPFGGLETSYAANAAYVVNKAPETFRIPQAGSLTQPGSSSTIFFAEVYDDSNNKISDSVYWTIEAGNTTGIFLDSRSGAINVNSNAVAGKITVKAAYGGKSATKEVELTKEALVPAFVAVSKENSSGTKEIVTSDTIYIPTSGSISKTYYGTVYDQYGVEMASENVEWEATTTASGFTVADSEDGKSKTITVNSTTGVGKINLKLTDYYGTLKTNLAVTIQQKTNANVTLNDVPTEKIYGDTFTVKANAANKGTGTGTWTWLVSDSSALEIVSGGNTDTATFRVLKGGVAAAVTAKYESESTIGEATSADITLNKAKLTVKPKDQTIKVGEALPTFELECTGLPEGVDVATIIPDFASKVGTVESTVDGKTAGTFDITAPEMTVAAEYTDQYEIAKEVGTLTVNKVSYSSGRSHTQTALEKAKTEAKADVKTEAEASKYDTEETSKVAAIKAQADKDIAAAKTVEEVEKIKAEAEAQIEAIPTAEEKADKASVTSVDKKTLKATSKKSKLNGKKAVKVTWTLPEGVTVDGFEVYRSTKKSSGYGTEPYFTTTKTSYTNNKDLKSGTTYYYKVRGYKMINGEKVYTGYSTKAWRTV